MFECWYCEFKSKDLSGLVAHFEQEHRNKDEYIEIPVPDDIIEPRKESEVK
jgi:hypothetical protein